MITSLDRKDTKKLELSQFLILCFQEKSKKRFETQSRTKVPRRGTFAAKQLVSSWLKFLCEALGRSSLRTKLRASSMHLHGLSNK